jgi:hypothetical protein
MRRRSRSSSPTQKAYLSLYVPASLNHCVDEVDCYLVVALRGEGREYLPLLTSAHSRILKDLAELGCSSDDFAQVGEISQHGVEGLVLRGCAEEGACVSSRGGVGHGGSLVS